MGIYNRKLNKLDIDTNKLIKINSMVTNSIVYKYDNIILKKYWWYTDYAISEDIFDILSSIDNKHLIKLYELFTIIEDENYENYYNKLMLGKKYFCTDGYTAKFYKKSDLNPLLVDSKYLLNNIEELKELIDLLSNKHILMYDVKIENAIIMEDGIVIIDPDYYEVTDLSKSKIDRNNYKELLYLIKSLFLKYSDNEFNNIFNKLKNSNYKESIDFIEKSLKKVKKPIDLIIK